MPSTRLPLPASLFKPVVCPAKNCQSKDKPILLHDGTPALPNSLDLLDFCLRQYATEMFAKLERELIESDDAPFPKFLTSLIRDGFGPEDIRLRLAMESKTKEGDSFAHILRSMMATSLTITSSPRSEALMIGRMMLMVQGESQGSPCLHELYSSKRLAWLARELKETGARVDRRNPAKDWAPLIKSIRKFLLSKSATPAQKLVWKKASNWEGMIVRGVENLVLTVAGPLIEDYTKTSPLAIAFFRLFTAVSTPMHLHAILLSELSGMGPKATQRHLTSVANWSEGIHQIIAVLETKGAVDAYVLNSKDEKRVEEIEKERLGLTKEVDRIEVLMEDLRSKLSIKKSAAEKLDEERSKFKSPASTTSQATITPTPGPPDPVVSHEMMIKLGKKFAALDKPALDRVIAIIRAHEPEALDNPYGPSGRCMQVHGPGGCVETHEISFLDLKQTTLWALYSETFPSAATKLLSSASSTKSTLNNSSATSATPASATSSKATTSSKNNPPASKVTQGSSTPAPVKDSPPSIKPTSPLRPPAPIVAAVPTPKSVPPPSTSSASDRIPKSSKSGADISDNLKDMLRSRLSLLEPNQMQNVIDIVVKATNPDLFAGKRKTMVTVDVDSLDSATFTKVYSYLLESTATSAPTRPSPAPEKKKGKSTPITKASTPISKATSIVKTSAPTSKVSSTPITKVAAPIAKVSTKATTPSSTASSIPITKASDPASKLYTPASSADRLFRSLYPPLLNPNCSPQNCSQLQVNNPEDIERLDVLLASIFKQIAKRTLTSNQVLHQLGRARKTASPDGDDSYLASSSREMALHALKELCFELKSLDVNTAQLRSKLQTSFDSRLNSRDELYKMKILDPPGFVQTFFDARKFIGEAVRGSGKKKHKGDPCICALLCNMDSLEEFSNALGSEQLELAGPTHVAVAHAADAVYVYANCLNNPSTNPPWVAGDKNKVITRLEKLVKSLTVPEWILQPDCESMFNSYWEMFNFVGGIALYRLSTQIGDVENSLSERAYRTLKPLQMLLHDEIQKNVENGAGLTLQNALTLKKAADAVLNDPAYSIKPTYAAVDQYQDSALINPRSLAVHNNCALARLKIDNEEQLSRAVCDCTTALFIDPNNLKAFYRRGIALSRLNHPALAILDLERALLIEPTNDPVLEELEIAKKRLSFLQTRKV